MKWMCIVIIEMLVFSGLTSGALSLVESKATLETEDRYDMVIIAPEVFAPEIQPLIDHKNAHGIQTFLKTTEDIYVEYNGRDQAEQIKYFIKDALELYNIEYVLLIGGRKGQLFDWYIPVRYANVNDGYIEKFFLSDLYFADIYKENTTEFDDWDSDGDNVFAEWKGRFTFPQDTLDVKPDVCLGRLPCRNMWEVREIVRKIIEYETMEFPIDLSKRIVLMGGDTNPGVGEPFPYEGEVTTEWILNYLQDFEAIKLYTSDGTLNDASDVIQAIGKGCSFVYYAGHGWPNYLGTFPPNDEKIIDFFHTHDIRSLKNSDMYPIMLSVCCLTTSFDVSLLNFLLGEEFYSHRWAYECLGWRLVRQPNAGAIAYIGSSSTAWGDIGDKNEDNIPDAVQNGRTSGLCNEFFRIYGEGDLDTVGKIFAQTLSNYVDDFSMDQDSVFCKCALEWILIGDPSLKLGGYVKGA